MEFNDASPRSSSSRSRTKRRQQRIASYRLHKANGCAVVTLTDAHTRNRRDCWLGEHGSPLSRELYHRVIDEWEANDRRLPAHRGAVRTTTLVSNGTKHGDAANAEAIVKAIIRDDWRSAKTYYSPSERTSINTALRVLWKLIGTTPAIEFGPNRLRLVRDDMVKGDPTGDNPRSLTFVQCL